MYKFIQLEHWYITKIIIIKKKESNKWKSGRLWVLLYVAYITYGKTSNIKTNYYLFNSQRTYSHDKLYIWGINIQGV